MRFQLREYRIEDGRLDEFVREWRSAVLPLRVSAGFSVLGPWIEREEGRFVWIVGYDGDIRSAEEAFRASPARAALSPDPARFVVESRRVWLEAPL
jgi:hypothetical protein